MYTSMYHGMVCCSKSLAAGQLCKSPYCAAAKFPQALWTRVPGYYLCAHNVGTFLFSSVPSCSIQSRTLRRVCFHFGFSTKCDGPTSKHDFGPCPIFLFLLPKPDGFLYGRQRDNVLLISPSNKTVLTVSDANWYNSQRWFSCWTVNNETHQYGTSNHQQKPVILRHTFCGQ